MSFIYHPVGGPGSRAQSAAGRSGTHHVGRHPEKACKSPIVDSPVRHVVDIKYLMSHNKQNAAPV
jgi:hypothetical protein